MAFTFLSRPATAKCYQDNQGSFPAAHIPKEEWLSVWELPLFGALLFRIISERCFAQLTSPVMWGKAGVEFINNNGLKISREAIPMAILVTDGMGEGNLGMVTTFCCHNQAKMEASNSLSALHQCDSLKPSVVVVRRYTNTPYILWGSTHFLYLDVSTLSGGASSTQFPLDWLHLCRLFH